MSRHVPRRRIFVSISARKRISVQVNPIAAVVRIPRWREEGKQKEREKKKRGKKKRKEKNKCKQIRFTRGPRSIPYSWTVRETFMSAPGTFKDRVNEKRGVSRRQSGASNRISGLESDTTSGEPRFFYAGEGDRDLAFVYHHCHGRLRGTATMDNKRKRGRPSAVALRLRNHGSDSLRLEIHYASWQTMDEPPKRRINAACCARTWRGGTQLPRSASTSTFIAVTSRHEARTRRAVMLFLSVFFDTGT